MVRPRSPDGERHFYARELRVNRNIKTVLAVSVLFGAATGIYEFVLPYYLDECGLSYQSMANIFAIAAAGMLLLRILMGRMADLWGRKPFYGLALGGSALALWLTPTSASLLGQTLFKTLREAMFLTRDTLHPVVLYEEHRGRFMDFIGKTRGFEFLFQAAGTLLAGLTFAGLTFGGATVLALGASGNLRLGGLLLAAAFVLFYTLFRERPRDHHQAPQPGRLRDLFSLDMHRNLKVILISFFIFNIGFTTSHCFIMPLFFSKKFGVSEYAVSWVMGLHRVTIALPLLLAGAFRIKRLKAAYIGTLTVEGIILSASAFMPGFAGASIVWLLHDLVGAGIWIPIQNFIIQEYTEPDRRALQVGKLLAYGGLGTILGPWLAGHLLEAAYLPEALRISAPFFVSGLFMIVAALILFALRLEPTHRQALPHA